MYDIIIVGAGPAGLTAAIYGRRAGKKVLVLEKDTFGGQITFSPKLENYPGFEAISGNELAQRMLEQALALGAEIDMDTVVEVHDGFIKEVIGENSTYLGKTVIIAAGSKHRRLGLDREEEFIGNGISFCAVCDGAFYAGQHVALIGGGNTALQEAILLSETCSHVTVVQNLPFLTGEAKLVQALEGRKNVSYLFSTVVTAYEGSSELEQIRLQNTQTGEEQILPVDGLFLAVGTEPENQPYRAVTDQNDYGYIIADENCRTGRDGIFVAGDCRTKAYRQVATAIADGATAALNACRFLDQ
ncbi:MAG: FAD-dependent oxidoreductase [Oscillospiraceae bacterium]|nr:FAD-dependent oxidoreductase [Oscillospiraceae bacterium]